MKPNVPTAGAKKPEGQPAPQPAAKMSEADWRSKLVKTATAAGEAIASRDRVRNPMVPDNIFDFSRAGFPSDLDILPLSIPRQGVPAEMAQYRDMLNRQWQHLPFDVISGNGGQDGKAYVPGCEPRDMGGGHLVATLAGHYLMYANRHQHHERRSRNTEKGSERVRYKMEAHTDEEGHRRDGTDTGPMTVEELFEYEKSIGSESPIMGGRLER